MLWSLSAEIAVSSPWHEHDIFEFALCRDQGGWLQTRGNEIALRPARTILIPPNTPHRFIFGENEIARLKIVCFPPGDLPRFFSPGQVAVLDGLRRIDVSVADHPGRDPWLGQLCDVISDGLMIEDERTQYLSWSAIGLLLALHAKERQGLKDHASVRHRAKVQNVVDWVEENLSDTLTIDRATSLFGLSRSVLTKEFRRYTGKSFVDYCNSRRVQKAAMALVTRADSVTQVALESGFSNLSHFHRQFKMQFGLTPAAFRRKIVEEGGL